MKKVFISVPMKGRTKENIEYSIAKIKAIASAYFDEELEFMNTVVEDKPPYEMDPVHNAIWYLGRSISLMATCDVLVTTDIHFKYSGCFMERRVADEYEMPVLVLDSELICPDLVEEEEENECELEEQEGSY